MHIELTDHLRCPADHPESFLVLIPGEMRGRNVLGGVLGCPTCLREYPVVDGVVHFSPDAPVSIENSPADTVNADAIAAFLGLEGPGGYVGLIGAAAGFAADLATSWPGIHLVLVNPPAEMNGGDQWSVLLSPALPFKARSLRGIVVGAPYGAEQRWSEAAVTAVLPGLRAAGKGPVPEVAGFEVMGEAAGWWVGRSS